MSAQTVGKALAKYRIEFYQREKVPLLTPKQMNDYKGLEQVLTEVFQTKTSCDGL